MTGYGLAGKAPAAGPATDEKLPTNFEALRKMYDAHRHDRSGDEEHPDIRVRLRIVRALGVHKDPAAIGFLKTVAETDAHWDVSEEAVKVLCTYGRAALGQMIELLESKNWRVYLKTAPAETVGRLHAVEAVEALRKLARDGNPLNRIAALGALSQIARGRGDQVAAVAVVLTAGLEDREGVVQAAAVEGLALLAGKLGERRAAALAAVRKLLDSKNPVVAREASKALKSLSH